MNTAIRKEKPFQGLLVKLNNEYSVRVVDNLADFETLKEAWDRLASTQIAYFPFLCFDWYSMWLKHFLKNMQLFILLLYKGGQIVSIAPFTVKREKRVNTESQQPSSGC